MLEYLRHNTSDTNKTYATKRQESMAEWHERQSEDIYLKAHTNTSVLYSSVNKP